MPLTRFEVKNEYGLGDGQLFVGESKKDDPKKILEVISVAGFVGILRQLGDLAEFAANIFNDIQEQVTTTSSRWKKISTRIQHIESVLPSLEKAVQSQRNYIHFSYIAGSSWHANLQTDQSQLLCSILPQFMIDLYEECHDPPQLYLLDKFDTSGPGACLKRFSDPSYFKKALASSEPILAEKVKRKKKKKGSKLRSGLQHTMFASRDSNRTKSTLARDSIHFDTEFKTSNFVEQFSETICLVTGEPNYIGAPESKSNYNISTDSVIPDEHKKVITDDDSQPESLQQQSAPSTSSVAWDEKTEIVKSTCANLYDDEILDGASNIDSITQICDTIHSGNETSQAGNDNQEDIVFELAKELLSHNGKPRATDISEHEINTDFERRTIQESNYSNVTYGDLSSSRLNEADVTNFVGLDAQTLDNSFSFSNNSSLQNNFEHTQSVRITCPTHISNSLFEDGNSKNIPCVSEINIPEHLNDELSIELSVANEQDVQVNSGITDEISKSQDFSSNNSNLPDVKIWTNGGILGVEPSKPPDFTVKENSDAPSTTSGYDLSTISNTMSHSSDSEKMTGISTRISGFAHKFLSDSIQKKILIANAGLSTQPQLMNADFKKLQEILRQNDFKDLPKRVVTNPLCESEAEDFTKVGSSSPPLEHMKISFDPINILKTSILNLEFSGGKIQEGVDYIEYWYPSFRLIPQHTTTIIDCGSDSDDDTFCRSSTYSNDDILSYNSMANSDDSCRDSLSTMSSCNSTKSKHLDKCNVISDLDRTSTSMKAIENLDAHFQSFQIHEQQEHDSTRMFPNAVTVLHPSKREDRQMMNEKRWLNHDYDDEEQN